MAEIQQDYTHLRDVVSRVKRGLSAKDHSLSMQERGNKDFQFHKMRLDCKIAEAETTCRHRLIPRDLIYPQMIQLVYPPNKEPT